MPKERRVETDHGPTGASRQSAVWWCFAGMMCLAICVNLPPVYLTTFSATFGGQQGLTDEQLGRISAVIFSTLVAGIVVSGPLADRWGARLFAIIGLALTAVGLVCLGTAQSYGGLLTACGFMGLGGGILDMVLSPIVCALQPDRRSAAMNWLHSFYCVGAVGTALAGAQALRVGLPWRVVTISLAVVPLVVTAGFAAMRIPPLVDEAEERTPMFRLLTQVGFVAALAAILLAGATEQGMSQWLPTFTERVLGYSKAAGGMTLAGFLIAMVAGRWGAAMLGHKVRPLWLMYGCGVGCVVLFVVATVCPAPPVGVAACVGVGLCCSCLWPTLLGVTADRFPHGGASMFSLLAAAGNAGCFIMPWTIGFVATRHGLRTGLGTGALAPVLLLAAVAVVAASTHQRPST